MATTYINYYNHSLVKGEKKIKNDIGRDIYLIDSFLHNVKYEGRNIITSSLGKQLAVVDNFKLINKYIKDEDNSWISKKGIPLIKSILSDSNKETIENVLHNEFNDNELVDLFNNIYYPEIPLEESYGDYSLILFKLLYRITDNFKNKLSNYPNSHLYLLLDNINNLSSIKNFPEVIRNNIHSENSKYVIQTYRKQIDKLILEDLSKYKNLNKLIDQHINENENITEVIPKAMQKYENEIESFLKLQQNSYNHIQSNTYLILNDFNNYIVNMKNYKIKLNKAIIDYNYKIKQYKDNSNKIGNILTNNKLLKEINHIKEIIDALKKECYQLYLLPLNKIKNPIKFINDIHHKNMEVFMKISPDNINIKPITNDVIKLITEEITKKYTSEIINDNLVSKQINDEISKQIKEHSIKQITEQVTVLMNEFYYFNDSEIYKKNIINSIVKFIQSYKLISELYNNINNMKYNNIFDKKLLNVNQKLSKLLKINKDDIVIEFPFNNTKFSKNFQNNDKNGYSRKNSMNQSQILIIPSNKDINKYVNDCNILFNYFKNNPDYDNTEYNKQISSIVGSGQTSKHIYKLLGTAFSIITVILIIIMIIYSISYMFDLFEFNTDPLYFLIAAAISACGSVVFITLHDIN